MALVNRNISSLINGVSQQPAEYRLDSQCSLLENAYPSLVEGLRKRPPFEHIAKLRSGTLSNVFLHGINRDASERYIVLVFDDDLEVYDLAGTAQTVSFPNGKGYLNTTDAKHGFGAVTIADHTFILNKQVTVAQGTRSESGVCTITIAAPGVVTLVGHGYTVDKAIQFSTTGTLPTGLTAGVTYYVRNPTADTFEVSATKGGASITTTGTQSGVHTVYRVVDGTVQSFDKLPTTPADGDWFKVTGDATNPFDNYYIRFNAATNVWNETNAPAGYNSLDASTMPHILVRTGPGTFDFKQATWDTREVGDVGNAPAPHFVGRTITEMMFYRNRLGLAADETVAFSRASDVYNFWPRTATAVLDTDPVLAGVSHQKVSLIRHATPFNKAMVLFSDQTQFVHTVEQNLKPGAGEFTVATEFEADQYCKPEPMGSMLYFPVNNGEYAAIREYFVEKDAVTNDAADITAHVPKYVPKDVTKITSSNTDDCLLATSATDTTKAYFYKFKWSGDEKVQSAWGVWTLAATDEIKTAITIAGIAYFIIQRSDGIYLERVRLTETAEDADLGMLVHLDRRLYLTGSYDSGTNTTTWTLPYAETAPMQVITGGDFGGSKAIPLTITRPDSTHVAAIGNWTAGECYIGRKYTMRYRFSEQFVRDAQNVPVLDGRLQLRKMTVSVKDTGYIRAEITPYQRDLYSHGYTGKMLGAGVVIGAVNLGTGRFTFPIYSDSKTVQIDLVNDSYLPCKIRTAEWVGFYSPKSRRL